MSEANSFYKAMRRHCKLSVTYASVLRAPLPVGEGVGSGEQAKRVTAKMTRLAVRRMADSFLVA